MHVIEPFPNSHKTGGLLINTLARLRLDVLPRMTGHLVSQFDLSLTLGISPKLLARYEKMREADLPPSLLLACEYIERAGLEECDSLPDPTPKDVNRLVDSIMLSREETATLLGKRRQVLYSLETGSHQRTIKRFYLYALLRLRELYGLTVEEQDTLKKRLNSGLHYRDLIQRPKRKTHNSRLKLAS